MQSNVQAAETLDYEHVHDNPYMRIHGRPTRSDCEIIKHEAATLARKVEDITYAWICDASTSNKYGILAEI